MRFLISPTAFKGTLTPSEAAHKLEKIFQKQFPGASFTRLPLADGGDGTLDVLQTALHGKTITTRVRGPLGKPVLANWAKMGRTAVIEMARASGLALVKTHNRIMDATSFGTGELIKAALDRGCGRILIGVGGTACGEGGAGALEALGLRYFDEKGRLLSAAPNDLIRLQRVDWKNFDSRLKRTDIRILCDVRNPLLGKNGSARTFGPQKGATPSQVHTLEKTLSKWARFARRDMRLKPGAGAAGALAFGLAGFAGAKLTPGTPFLMEAIQWKKAARRADVIVTGEGRLDKTSFQGKVIGEIVRRRGRAKVWAVCGSSTLTVSDAKRRGLDRLFALKDFLKEKT